MFSLFLVFFQVQTLAPWFRKKHAELAAADLEIFWHSDALVAQEERDYLYNDLALASYSVLVVFVLVWSQTKSLCISLAGITLILLSVPVSTGFYTVVRLCL